MAWTWWWLAPATACPLGEWLIVPLSVSSGLSVDVYSTAGVFKDGVEYLALYQAVRQQAGATSSREPPGSPPHANWQPTCPTLV